MGDFIQISLRYNSRSAAVLERSYVIPKLSTVNLPFNLVHYSVITKESRQNWSDIAVWSLLYIDIDNFDIFVRFIQFIRLDVLNGVHNFKTG